MRLQPLSQAPICVPVLALYTHPWLPAAKPHAWGVRSDSCWRRCAASAEQGYVAWELFVNVSCKVVGCFDDPGMQGRPVDPPPVGADVACAIYELASDGGGSQMPASRSVAPAAQARSVVGCTAKGVRTNSSLCCPVYRCVNRQCVPAPTGHPGLHRHACEQDCSAAPPTPPAPAPGPPGVMCDPAATPPEICPGGAACPHCGKPACPCPAAPPPPHPPPGPGGNNSSSNCSAASTVSFGAYFATDALGSRAPYSLEPIHLDGPAPPGTDGVHWNCTLDDPTSPRACWRVCAAKANAPGNVAWELFVNVPCKVPGCFGSPVKTRHFAMPFMYKSAPFCQDRLGTDIGKTQKQSFLRAWTLATRATHHRWVRTRRVRFTKQRMPAAAATSR